MTPNSRPNKKLKYSPIELNSNMNPHTSLKNLICILFFVTANKKNLESLSFSCTLTDPDMA